MRFRRFFILLLLAVLSFSGCGGSGGSLPVAQMQAMLEKSVHDSGVPGAILAVQTPAGSWVGAAGTADFADGSAIRPEMQVRLASVTKSLTAILVMKLVEDHVLCLTDTVEQWLPGLIPHGSEMTIQMLLSHRAGVYNATELESFWDTLLLNPARDWPSGEVIGLAHGLTPMFTPGSDFYYTNTGYYLLGMIVEAATGNTLAAEISNRIFSPLGLARTRLTRQGFMDEPCTHGYTWLPTTGQVADNTGWNLSWDWTAGAAVSTGAEMLKLMQALMGGLILSKDTVALMTTPTEPGGYGLGIGKVLETQVFKTTLIGHSGENPGTATFWYYFPDYKTTIFVAVNRSDTRTHATQDIPIEGSAAAYDIFKKSWEILRSAP